MSHATASPTATTHCTTSVTESATSRARKATLRPERAEPAEYDARENGESTCIDGYRRFPPIHLSDLPWFGSVPASAGASEDQPNHRPESGGPGASRGP